MNTDDKIAFIAITIGLAQMLMLVRKTYKYQRYILL